MGAQRMHLVHPLAVQRGEADDPYATECRIDAPRDAMRIAPVIPTLVPPEYPTGPATLGRIHAMR